MKYWSFWYFWSIFFLILTALCNFETRIPICQNLRSRAEWDHGLPWLPLCVLLHPWLGHPLCPQASYSSRMGSSLPACMLSQGRTNVCPHPLAGPCWFLQSISEVVSCFCKVPQLCLGSGGSLEERHLLVLQPIWAARGSRNGVSRPSEKAWPWQVPGRF